MFSEIRAVTVGVSDLARSIDFYHQAFGYEPSSICDLSGGAFERACLAPAGTHGRCAVMGPQGCQSGLLRLVSFDVKGRRIWGQYNRQQDYGHYALNIRVAEIHSALDRVLVAGGRLRTGPRRWSPSRELLAWDSLSYDPDGIVLDIFQINAASESPLSSFCMESSAIQTVAIHVSDAERSSGIYQALGYSPLYDKLISGMETFFGIPDGTDLRNINLYMPTEPECGRIELAEYVGLPGMTQSDQAVPPNVGILSVSLETDNLSSASKQLHSFGVLPAGDRATLELPPFGMADVQTFFGPDREVLEIVQRR